MLNQIFREQLYRTRVWSRKEVAYSFSKAKIDEFKGVTFNDNKSFEYPYQNRRLLENFALKFTLMYGLSLSGIKYRFSNTPVDAINPFVQINQSIINGKAFFEYTETYVETYKRLFLDKGEHSEKFQEFRKFYREYCKDYSGAHRTGDGYLREIYKSLLFLMFDKFGEKGLLEYYETLYSLVYRIRLEMKQVRYASTAQKVGEYFSIIEKAKKFYDLQELKEKAKAEKVKCCYSNCVGVYDCFMLKVNSKNLEADERLNLVIWNLRKEVKLSIQFL